MAKDLARLQAAAAPPPKRPSLDIAKTPILAPKQTPPAALPLPPPSAPSTKPVTMPPPSPAASEASFAGPPAPPRRLADILAEAKRRAQAGALPRPAPAPERAPQKAEKVLLPIEEEELKPEAKALSAIKEKEEEAPQKFIEPPDNLPTEKPLAVQKPAAPPSFVPTVSAESRPAASEASFAGPRKTPEEILGLPQKAPAPPLAPTPELPAKPEPAPEAAPAAAPLPPIPPPPIPAEQPKRRGLRPLKFGLLAGGLGFITIGLIGVVTIFIQKPAPPPPPPPSGPIEEPLPQALITYSQIEEVAIGKLSYDELKPKLDVLESLENLPGSVAYVPVKIVSKEKISYLTLAELFNALRIDAPPTFFAYDRYTLFLYTQKTEMADLCKSQAIINSLCYGPRLGIVLELPEAPSVQAVEQTMKEWEKTIAEDLRPLMLFAPQAGAVNQFALGKHGQFDTHYINLPIHTMSVDWILTGKHLIIATSKDAARAALDALK